MGRPKTGKIMKCLNCGKERYVAQCLLDKGYGKYCSNICVRQSIPVWNKGLTKETDFRVNGVAKKMVGIMTESYKDGTRDRTKVALKAHEAVRIKSEKKFKENPGTYFDKNGYRHIYVPSRGWVKYHHYIWEQHNGRVPIGYHLHHIDFDKTNNTIENLKLLTESAHHKLHTALLKRNSSGQFIKTF